MAIAEQAHTARIENNVTGVDKLVLSEGDHSLYNTPSNTAYCRMDYFALRVGLKFLERRLTKN